MKLHILILATGKPAKELIDAITQRGHSYECYSPLQLTLYVSDSVNGYDRIYAEVGESEPKRLVLKSYNAIITRLSGTGEFGLAILEHLNRNLGIFSGQTANGIRTASNKVMTSQAVSHAGLRCPVTIHGRNYKNASYFINKLWDEGIVYKSPFGSQGKTVSPQYEKRSAISSLEMLNGCDVDVLVQQMLNGGGADYRVIVIGNRVVCTMKRSSKDGSFFANISKGAKGELVKLTKEHEEFCVRAAKAVGLDIAGVDVMYNKKDNKLYLIEVNSNFGCKSIGITGINWFVDWVKFLEENYTKKSATYKADLTTDSMIQLYNTGFKTAYHGHSLNNMLSSWGDKEKLNYLLGWQEGNRIKNAGLGYSNG
jgi:ribosomal protein S6--L-glutamate ligase